MCDRQTDRRTDIHLSDPTNERKGVWGGSKPFDDTMQCNGSQLVGSAMCGFAAWALYDGRASESAAGRAGLCALGAWAAALTVGSLAALTGAVRGSASLLAAAFALLALRYL